MNPWINKLLIKFKRSNTIEQLIYINIIIFALSYLTATFTGLTLKNDHFINQWFALPSSFSDFILKPWTIISYGFLHGGIFHIGLNLILLFYIGNLFLDFFSKKDFFTYYFFGIGIGGLAYLMSYAFFPTITGDPGFLVGASAGVTAILVGLAAKIPNYALHFRFIGPIKLWYIAVALILIDVIQLANNNTGGRIAHLGGALIGYILTTVTFSKKVKKTKKTPLKTVFKNDKKTDTSKEQEKIDAILDKISKSGYASLNQQEKDFLFSIQSSKTTPK